MNEPNQIEKLAKVTKPPFTLDLEKYGLSYLYSKHIRDIRSSEIDTLLNAFIKENIAPAFYCTPSSQMIDELLHKSYCRHCGKCCQPNPMHLLDPGVEVLEKELELMKKHCYISHRSLKKRTHIVRQFPDPIYPDAINSTKWILSLPCIFYDFRNKQCKVYKDRPQVCRLYPIKPADSYISINVYCDYGKDIYKSIISEITETAPDSIFVSEP